MRQSIGLLVLLSFSGLVFGSNGDGKQPASLDAESLLKVSPKAIRELRLRHQSQEAARNLPLFEKKMLSNSSVVTLAPGEESPIVFIDESSPTALKFMDVAGAPWPIQSELKDTEKLGIKLIKNGIDNVVLVHSKVAAGTYYVPFGLQDLASPVFVKMIVDEKRYQRDKTIRVERLGPNTKNSFVVDKLVSQLGLPPDEDVNSALHGVRPVGGQTLISRHVGTKAWSKGDYLYIRTRLHIFSPEIERVESAEGGYYAYKLRDVHTVLATNDVGDVVELAFNRPDHMEASK